MKPTVTAEQLFEALWQDYVTRLCPSAQQVHDLLQEDALLLNDHIALRTFDLAPLGLDTLAKPFLDLGYHAQGEYHFERKKLYARHFEHPDPSLPKVFISELNVAQCSLALQAMVTRLVAQVDEKALQSSAFLSNGRPWQVSFEEYQRLVEESEYAAWLAAHGYGANHFTVSVNQLRRFDEVREVNQCLRAAGFAINEAGGEVKGSPDVLLEQSSTIADKVPVWFSDAKASIPGGFYEFAKRYPTTDGHLYRGFVEASADKIFESTNAQSKPSE